MRQAAYSGCVGGVRNLAQKVVRCGMCALATSVIGVAAARAGLLSVPPAHVLERSVDTIVAGTVDISAGLDGGSPVSVRVKRVVKGDKSAPAPGTLLRVKYSDIADENAGRRVAGKSRILMFLKNEQPVAVIAGTQSAAIVYGENESDDVVQYSIRDTPLDKLYRELAVASLQGSDSALSSLVQSVATIQAPPDAAKEVAEQLAGSQSTDRRVAGLQLLILLGDQEALTRLAVGEQQLLKTAFAPRLIEAIRTRYRPKDAAATENLIAIFSSANVREFRLACAFALARLHSMPTLPVLAGMIDSDDNSLITIGIGGLAMFANNVVYGRFSPEPGEWRYRSEETMRHSVMDENKVRERQDMYVRFWKAWWQQHRAELEGK